VSANKPLGIYLRKYTPRGKTSKYTHISGGFIPLRDISGTLFPGGVFLGSNFPGGIFSKGLFHGTGTSTQK